MNEDELKALNERYEELSLFPDSVYKNLELGKILVKLGREKESIVYFEQVIVAEPSNLEALEALLKIYNSPTSRNRNLDLAGEIAERILRIRPNHEEASLIHPQKYERKTSRRLVVDSYDTGDITDVISYVNRNVYIGRIIFCLYLILILFTLSITVLRPIVFRTNDSKIEQIAYLPDDASELGVNSMTDLDGYSKKDIYDIREEKIFKSMFKNNNYTPSDDVFGGIQDGKLWYGCEHYVCFDRSKGSKYRAEGVSFLSKFINNPEYLIGAGTPYAWDNVPDESKYPICTDKNVIFMPESISYSKKLNMITSVHKLDKRIYGADNLPYMLYAINARDLGYNWGYVFNKKNIQFKNTYSGIDRNVHQFSDFIAVCGISKGCNHLCSIQEPLMFSFLSSKEAIIDLKLWKERPLTVLAKPDMYYRLIFRK